MFFFVFLFFFDFLRFLRQRPRFRAWEVFFLLTDWAISARFVFDFSWFFIIFMIFHDSEDNLLNVFLCNVKAVRPFSCSALTKRTVRSQQVRSLHARKHNTHCLVHSSVLSTQYWIRHSVLSTEYSVLGAQYAKCKTQHSVLSTQYSVPSIQYLVFLTQHRVPSTQISTQYSVLSTQYLNSVSSTQYSVLSAQCMLSAQCSVLSTQFSTQYA